MHHTSRRLKRFERSTSSSRVFTGRLHESNGPSQLQLPSEDPGIPSSSRHRRAVQLQLDPLRGAMLVAIIVVTIVLYLALWQLERSSFSSVPSGNFDSLNAENRTAISQPFVTSARLLEKYPVTVVQDASISRPTDQPNSQDGRSAVSSTDMDRLPPKAAAWPPLITRVPEEQTGDFKEETAGVHTNEDVDPPSSLSDSFDVAYCNGTCRFLLPVRVGEQESKARLHFIQLLKLAKRLNRTLVLPNVGKSRMSACSKWPFETYYDTNAFTSRSPGLPTTTNLSTFMRWIDERPALPSSFFVSMDSLPKDHWRAFGSLDTQVDLPFVVEDTGVDPKVSSCLGSKLPRLRSSVPATGLSIVFGPASHEMHPNASDHIVQLLSGRLNTPARSDFDLMTGPGYKYPHIFPEYPNPRDTSLADVDVLVVDYDLRHPLFAHSDSDSGLYFNLHYASAFYDLADRISENLGPFVGVHWRMENVPVENLAWCAASLVSKLYRILQDEVMGKDIRHVLLATDYALPLVFNAEDAQGIPGGSRSRNENSPAGEHPSLNHGPPKKSSTFKTISPEHEDAMDVLTEAFQPGGDLDSWKLTDLADQLRWYPYVEGKFAIDEALLDDSGVFGILDKLVVVHAKVFVSGSPECSKVSSFSKQVIESRQESFETHRGRDSPRNVVEYFGK